MCVSCILLPLSGLETQNHYKTEVTRLSTEAWSSTTSALVKWLSKASVFTSHAGSWSLQGGWLSGGKVDINWGSHCRFLWMSSDFLLYSEHCYWYIVQTLGSAIKTGFCHVSLKCTDVLVSVLMGNSPSWADTCILQVLDKDLGRVYMQNCGLCLYLSFSGFFLQLSSCCDLHKCRPLLVRAGMLVSFLLEWLPPLWCQLGPVLMQGARKWEVHHHSLHPCVAPSVSCFSLLSSSSRCFKNHLSSYYGGYLWSSWSCRDDFSIPANRISVAFLCLFLDARLKFIYILSF